MVSPQLLQGILAGVDDTVGQLHPEGMITGKIKMDEVVDKGFKALLGEKREGHCKILVDVQNS